MALIDNGLFNKAVIVQLNRLYDPSGHPLRATIRGNYRSMVGLVYRTIMPF